MTSRQSQVGEHFAHFRVDWCCKSRGWEKSRALAQPLQASPRLRKLLPSTPSDDRPHYHWPRSAAEELLVSMMVVHLMETTKSFKGVMEGFKGSFEAQDEGDSRKHGL